MGHVEVTWKASRAQHGSVIMHLSIMCIIFNEFLVFWRAVAASVSSYTSMTIITVLHPDQLKIRNMANGTAL